MHSISTRLANIERKAHQKKKWKVLITHDGINFIDTPTRGDYRPLFALPNAEKTLTCNDVAEMEKTHNVIIIEYVDWQDARL